MKRLLLVLTIAMAATLAACGGGGGSTGGGGGGFVPTPTVAPTATPASIALTIHFVGGVSGGSIESVLRPAVTTASITPSDIVTLVSPDATPDPGGAFSINTDEGAMVGYIQVLASPAPSPLPTLSATTDSSSASISATPSPAPSQSPLTTVPTVKISETQPNVSETKTVSVNLGGATATTPQETFFSNALVCATTRSVIVAEDHRGLSFDANGAAVAQSTIAASDVYMTAPACPGAFNTSAGTDAYLHFPFGAVMLSGSVNWAAISPSSWSNATTAIRFFDVAGPILFKCSDGRVVKMSTLNMVFSDPAATGLMFAVSGKSPDGF